MHLCLVAGDYSQSNVLEMLGNELKIKGHTVDTFFRKGGDRLNLEQIADSLDVATLAVVAMSDLCEEELFAVNRRCEKVQPFVLWADHRCYRLPAFEFVRNLFGSMFVLSGPQAAEAEKYFPNMDIVVTGNPSWEDFSTPKMSSSEAKVKLGIPDKSLVVLCVGDKYLDLNEALFLATIESVRMMGDGTRDVYVVLSLHPGDPNTPDTYARFAADDVRVVGTRLGIPTSTILSGCNVVVNFRSTVAVEAMHLRIPVIDYCPTVGMNRFWNGRLPIIGKDPSDNVELGTSVPVYFDSTCYLSYMIQSLLSLEGAGHMLEQQSRNYPARVKGEAIGKMIEHLLRGC